MNKNFIVAPKYPNELMHAPAELFRHVFSVKKIGRAVLHICALGLGYAYINGKRVRQDLFMENF